MNRVQKPTFYDNKLVKEQDFHTDGIFEHPLQRETVNSKVQATPLAWLTFAFKLRDCNLKYLSLAVALGRRW